MNRRAAISLISLVLLLVFLLGLTLHKLEKETKARRAFESSVINKLVEVFVPVIRQETESLRAGVTPSSRLETIIERLAGIDPAIIEEAVRRAMREVASTTTTQRSSSTTSTSARQLSTTSTSRVNTTTTAPMATTSSTRAPPTTTTTAPKPCTLGLNVPGLAKVCL